MYPIAPENALCGPDRLARNVANMGARPTAPAAPAQSTVYNHGRRRETYVWKGGRGPPAPARQDQRRSVVMQHPFEAAVATAQGAGRKPLYTAGCGRFPEQWVSFSGALGVR